MDKGKPADPTLLDRIHEDISLNPDKNVIISFEGFSHPERSKMANHLAAIFEPYTLQGYNIKIIIYLRRQDHHLESVYKQYVKSIHYRITTPADEYFRTNEPRDYYSLLTLWSRYFGKENIIVRIYENGQVNEDIVVDFMQTIGLKMNPDFRFPEHKQSNRSLGSLPTEILRICNKSGIPYEQYELLLKKMIQLRPSENEYSYLSPQQRIKILKSVEKSNMKVASQYLGRKDGTLFRESFPEGDTGWESPQGLDLETALPFLLRIMQSENDPCNKKNYHQLNNKLKRAEIRLEEIQGSFSFRLGLILTFPVRYIFNTFSGNKIR